jgi:hypothetical protein
MAFLHGPRGSKRALALVGSSEDNWQVDIDLRGRDLEEVTDFILGRLKIKEWHKGTLCRLGGARADS